MNISVSASPTFLQTMPKSTTTNLLLLLLIIIINFIHATTTTTTITTTTTTSSSPVTIIKAGFWPSWSKDILPPSSINFSYFTHLFYSFIPIDQTSFQLDISSSHNLWLTNFTTSAHSQSPPLLALISIGGGTFKPNIIANLVSNQTSRSTFINSTISTALHYKLDGFDLDWEFPSNPQQMNNLALLYKEWRAAITLHIPARRLLLTSSVYFTPDFFTYKHPRLYPVAIMAETLDWINAMCFDYHGKWEPSKTGLHSQLYDPVDNIGTDFGLHRWIEKEGMPSKKVVMGMPLYGRTWKLKDSEEHGVGSPAVGVGPDNNNGTMAYGKIVKFNEKENATVVHDKERVAVYSYAGKNWLGYDNKWSVKEKVDYGKKMGLGGYFLWAISYDHDWELSKTAWSAWEQY